MGGRPTFFSSRNTGDGEGTAREQGFGESSCNSPREMAIPAADVGNTNPSRLIEIESENLGVAPIIQEADKVEMESQDYVLHEISSGVIPDSALKDNVVEQPAGLGLIEVATCELADKKKLSVRRSHVGREKENEKSEGPTTVKQTGTNIQARHNWLNRLHKNRMLA
ncbi:hypothetical protein CMV_015412 [Castanea mollissima]|uniref:Uncharacterized protein n=1 Tax=Castanea mollissima TaxID=60419 RepID=A0A8J4RAN5_9ROSI|nr:hypothetical protein CMV_015412 [Castanea mollissima]